jgi:hypothetical protein
VGANHAEASAESPSGTVTDQVTWTN